MSRQKPATDKQHSEEDSPSDEPLNSNATEQSNSITSQADPKEEPIPIHPASQANRPFAPFEVHFLFEAILQNILKRLSHSNRYSRLDYLLLQLREKVPLKELIHKFDRTDLSIIAEHKKFIEIMDCNFHRLLQMEQYVMFKDLDYKTIILNAYSLIDDISLNTLRIAFIKGTIFKNKDTKMQQLLEELLASAKADIESNNIKVRTEEDELMASQIEGRLTEKVEIDPFTNFNLNTDKQFDEVSKYGIFSNRKEEMEVSKEGVFNYRIHRTMLAIDKVGLMLPQDNIGNAKKLALFLIKLTDAHIDSILKSCTSIAEATGKTISDQSIPDEFTYFSQATVRGKSTPKDYPAINVPSLQQYDQFSLVRLRYPFPMDMYRNLRKVELIQQENLNNNITPEIIAHHSQGKKRLNREEKAVLDYFTRKPNSNDCLSRLQQDTERGEPMKQKAGMTRTVVQVRHVKHFLQQHPFYREHQVLWRFNVIY